jgi:hypothetical protein
MAKSSNLYVGMDVHKESIDIALVVTEPQTAGLTEVPSQICATEVYSHSVSIDLPHKFSLQRNSREFRNN